MEITIRYDELKVRYINENVIVLKNSFSEEIYLPRKVLNNKGKQWVPLNAGEKQKVRWKDYLVDEIQNNYGWVWYYPTDYKKSGFYYKIRADVYFDDGIMCPAIEVPNDMADSFYKNLTKNKEYKSKVFFNKAPNDKFIQSANPSKIEGNSIKIKPICIWLKTGVFVEAMSVEKWLDEYMDYTKHLAVILEGMIENEICFIQMKHLTINCKK